MNVNLRLIILDCMYVCIYVHRSKTTGEKENLKHSKYLSLCGPSSRPLSHSNLFGEMKGVVTKVAVNDKGTVMTLHTASEEFLEIKVQYNTIVISKCM